MKNIFSTKQTILIALSLGLYLIGFFSSFPYLLEFERASSSKIDTIRNVIEYSIMFLSFLVFSIYFIRKNVFSKITIHLLVIILTLNFSLSASCFFIYKQGFNVGMMLSILETNISEVFSMLKTLVFPIISTIIFYVILLIILKDKVEISGKTKVAVLLFSSLWILLPIMFYAKHKYISNKGGGFMIKSIFYHAMDVKGALNLKDQIKSIQNTKVEYQLVKEDNTSNIENIVVLIGESARRRNMSLYGYDRETTPKLAKN